MHNYYYAQFYSLTTYIYSKLHSILLLQNKKLNLIVLVFSFTKIQKIPEDLILRGSRRGYQESAIK